MKFDPGFKITPTSAPLGFQYGQRVFGPQVENRTLDSIRKNLRDPNCTGPDIVYSIAMDVGCEEDREEIVKRNLLYGAVTYAKGNLGEGLYVHRDTSMQYLHHVECQPAKYMRFGVEQLISICRKRQEISREDAMRS